MDLERMDAWITEAKKQLPRDLWEPSDERWKNLVVHYLTLSRWNTPIPVKS